MKKIACLVKGYPRLSETFIAQEIHALEKAGIDVSIYSLRYPTDPDTHPVHRQIQSRIHYLPEYIYQNPVRLVAALASVMFRPQFFRLIKVFGRDLARDFSLNRARRLGQAIVLAREIEPDRNWIYAHFLHTPSSVARYTSILTGLPWSCSAHAKDIWTTPRWEIAEKLADMKWLVTCTRANSEHLKEIADSATKVSLLYHGLDLDRFPKPASTSKQDGETAQTRVRIVSVGRAVSKKGYDVLVDALSRLDPGFFWEFVHVGGGPLLQQLKQQADAHGIADNISWLGPKSFEEVLQCYQKADIFVLASRIDSSGDRDGLPNVLMEAMTQQLACIATDISGIPELLEHDHNGLLVAPEDPDSLARSIIELGRDPEKRKRLGRQGRQDVQQKFSLQASIPNLVKRFR